MGWWTPIEEKNATVVWQGEVIHVGSAEGCFRWMRENRANGRVVMIPSKPLQFPTEQDLAEWRASGFLVSGRQPEGRRELRRSA